MADAPKTNFLTCPIDDRALPPAPSVPVLTTRTKSTPPSPKPPRARRRGFGAAWIILILVVVVIAVLAQPIYGLARAAQSGLAAKRALTNAVTAMSDRDLPTATHELNQAHTALVSTRQALRGMGMWRDLPSVGTQIRALEDASGAGVEVVDALRGLLVVAEDLLSASASINALTGELANPIEDHRSFNDLLPEEKRAILARLSRALPDIRAAQAKITVALSTWERIPQDALYGPIKQAFQPIAEGLPRLKTTFDEAVPFLEILIPIAGYPEPSEYLVVLQNTDEIRATGGFLGTYGIIRMDGGDITRFEFDDVYRLDNPATEKGWAEVPPDPLKERLGISSWYFRDSNWSPDFPTSANRMADFYIRETELAGGQDIEGPTGVIAINAPVFEDLMRLVGPITVDEVTFTADNFFDTLEYEVEQNFLEKGIPVSERKQILIKVGDELMHRLTSLPAREWPTLLDIVTRGFEGKQIQMATKNHALMETLDTFGWTGRATPTANDFVWVIDSNLAALKTDGVMEKQMHYQLNATAAGGPTATLTLRYTNNAPGFREFRYTRYRDYVRVYVPEGAELIEAVGAMADDRYRTGGRPVPGRVDVYKELGKTVFGAFWSIEPTATQELRFTYRLPPGSLDGIAETGYRLDVPKQSGNDAVALTLDLQFAKPVMRALPGEDSAEFGDARYRFNTDMEFDRAFEIQF